MTRRAGLIVVVAATLAATAGCGSRSQAGAGSGGLSGVSSTPPASAPAPTGGATATPTDTTTTSTATSTHTTAKPPAGPRIVSFEVKTKGSCPVNGSSSSAPFSAAQQDTVLEWTTTGTTGVAMSLDSETYYKTTHFGSLSSDLPPSGSMTVPFVCDETQQPNTKHTYTLDTLGSDTQQKTVTVSLQTDP